MKTTPSPISNPINDSLLQCALILMPFVLMCVALLPGAQAVTPAPDGGYPGGNTAEGQPALLSLTTGTFNTAVGFLSLRSDTEGQFNTAVGAGALLANVGDQSSGTGVENTATGAAALLNNTTGNQNTATGAFALFSNTEGDFNSANGFDALFSNTTGARNTATYGLTAHGNTNTALGDSALANNIGLASDNTAIGADAGFFATTGRGNVYVGAGVTGLLTRASTPTSVILIPPR